MILKALRYTVAVILLGTMIFGLSACGGCASSERELIGIWILENDYAGAFIEVSTFEFNANNTFYQRLRRERIDDGAVSDEHMWEVLSVFRKLSEDINVIADYFGDLPTIFGTFRINDEHSDILELHIDIRSFPEEDQEFLAELDGLLTHYYRYEIIDDVLILIDMVFVEEFGEFRELHPQRMREFTRQ